LEHSFPGGSLRLIEYEPEDATMAVVRGEADIAVVHS
jgi:hypothetical protein